MAMGKKTYSQVIRIRRKDLKVVATHKKKLNKIKWRPIYEVIDEAYFIGSKIFSDYFMQECKDNSYEA